MTDEMFMRLLDLVQQAGEGGFVLAVIYLITPLLGHFFWGLTLLIAICRIAREIRIGSWCYQLISQATGYDDPEFHKQSCRRRLLDND